MDWIASSNRLMGGDVGHNIQDDHSVLDRRILLRRGVGLVAAAGGAAVPNLSVKHQRRSTTR
jgi:hypothetical protein